MLCDKDVVGWSVNYLARFRSAHVREAVSSGSSHNATIRWCNPEGGSIESIMMQLFTKIVIVLGLVLLFVTIWVRLWVPLSRWRKLLQFCVIFLLLWILALSPLLWSLMLKVFVDLINLGVAPADDIGVVIGRG